MIEVVHSRPACCVSRLRLPRINPYTCLQVASTHTPRTQDGRNDAEMRKPLLTLAITGLVGIMLSGCQSALFTGLNLRSGTEGVVVTKDIVFDQAHGLAMDVYRPATGEHLPTVVFFYGGSWKSGKRAWYAWLGETLARQGIVVVVPDYRLWPKVRMDGFVSDAARAVAYVDAHANEWHGDRTKLFLMGHSAGAHIAALLATDQHWLRDVGMQPNKLAGFIGLAGPYDFLPLTDDDFVDMFGHTSAEQARSQPVNFVDGDEPPMLLLQGTSDTTVKPSNTISLAKRLTDRGETVTVKMYPDMAHIGILLNLGSKDSVVRTDVVSFIKSNR